MFLSRLAGKVTHDQPFLQALSPSRSVRWLFPQITAIKRMEGCRIPAHSLLSFGRRAYETHYQSPISCLVELYIPLTFLPHRTGTCVKKWQVARGSWMLIRDVILRSLRSISVFFAWKYRNFTMRTAAFSDPSWSHGSEASSLYNWTRETW